MSKLKMLFGFHAVTARLRHDATSVKEIYYDPTRRDRRMTDFLKAVESYKNAPGVKIKLVQADGKRLDGMTGTSRHQGVVAQAEEISLALNLDELLDGISGDPLLLILDGVTDPHNLGACLRVADGAGAHAVIAPKDRAVGLNATVAKVASGAAETVPYIMVTNLARTLRDLKERGIWVVGTSDDAPADIYGTKLTGPMAIVMGAEGEGMRRLVGETCDELMSIPMAGGCESLNVSVASAVCLYEAVRQRKVAVKGK
ncbi:23S rRNA (guanosine(2251)-2'-O)-methyltransferase RlmB [Pandoraea anapnoica]|uniref:23S rRNA (guanosine-2'-O-)-methyltransferase RlmB n=2 Tax=Pandoraea TaxID=93217 RepID=A0A239SKG3_9BURK|nr:MULTISPECIES: 23S rRNA (guanosine(2251)-2'-O)-methyltransferase RlmB [Pandoraea]AJC17389.1 23S rRNA (guanosine(2251)-2'-O)-methyltransferase RlmB [Pandoraea sputorum]MCE4059167.1 23S rRNA (guanosine(2251)-2'-O)-methyltransferase RlmB [Pandoraea sputorum]SNU85702.1 23S rRNA (guanosine-2'-O-)-methyltransferase RlmB [Pandoraea sputorum]VVE39868.1 23S rRNA (guanosine(2251)-2'-O)-methyltransferase RlmB [Pandoraea sputorum]VVE70734.1 23S rRNA (guanosine(2251)-2'-O)-methyltransferase RlmB [Pandora